MKSLLDQFKNLELAPEETKLLKGGDGEDGDDDGYVVIEDQVIF